MSSRLVRPGHTPSVRFILYLFLGALLCACGRSSPELPPLKSDAVILSFGDSLTYGTGAGEGQSYPDVLEQLTGKTVLNAGVPGEVSADGLKRLPSAVEKAAPDLVILCHGGNDFLRKFPKSQTENNLRAMIDYLRLKNIPLVLIGVPNFGILLRTHELYETVAEDLEVPLEADIIPDLLGDNSYKSDQIHPNAAGYRRMAEAMQALLIDSGAL